MTFGDLSESAASEMPEEAIRKKEVRPRYEPKVVSMQDSTSVFTLSVSQG